MKKTERIEQLEQRVDELHRKVEYLERMTRHYISLQESRPNTPQSPTLPMYDIISKGDTP